MTVEQSSLQQQTTQRSREEILIQTYAKVKEITRIEDQRVIDEAINACRKKDGTFDVDDVVSMLIQDDSLRRRQNKSKTKSVSFPDEQVQGQGQGHSQGRESMKSPVQETTAPRKNNGKNNVIDLTHEAGEQQEINKAISASLQDAQGILGGQVTREEQDISRILEASLAESKAGTKRKRGELWFVDPLNPHERKRQGVWPVGLKNIGNTCWFSAVIQSLFYLPKFRRMVLNFKCPEQTSSNVPECRNLRFMKELSVLFGRMVGTTRKYVDPSKAVDILKEAFSSPSGVTDSQQDVSEFQHKLLEWLEDAFKSDQSQATHTPPTDASPSPPGASAEGLASNPVTELFYGQFRAEGEHEGEKFTKQETFGQFPLQVNGFRDIHESLEATTMQDEIETVNQGCTPHKSGQELWFTRLPPVLTFELCRFQFNQQLGRPEKIHNKIEFPNVIYVDRYLESNKTTTRRRREESRKLKEQLSTVQAKLDKFMNYGSGSKRCPLHDVLQYTLEFAESKPPSPLSSASLPPSSSSLPPSSASDVDMESPKTTSSPHTASPAVSTHTPPTLTSSSSSSSSSSSQCSAPSSLTGPQSWPSEAGGDGRVGSSVYPTPKQVSDSELRVLQSCLSRWRHEVEADVRELQTTISRLETKLDKMYSDDSMQKYPYQLHAVLVHEGQAASGHYWAFIFDQSHQRWLKFNDITVCESSWEELERESVGGYHNASAYCLMYVDQARVQDNHERGEACAASSVSHILDAIKMLPWQLQEEVALDNKKFACEIEEWDKEQARKTAAEAESSTPLQHRPTVSGSGQLSGQAQPSLAVCHAQLSFKDTVKAVDRVSDHLQSSSPAAALTQAAASELKRLQDVAESLKTSLPQDDARLRHMVVYLLYNCASNNTLHIVLLEQFAYLTLLDHTPRKKQLRLSSCEKINQMRKENSESGSNANEEYEDWHRRYHQFRQAAHMFTLGLRAYFKERYSEALPYFHQAWLHNRVACKGQTNQAGLDNRLISFFRRHCLQQVNGEAMVQFEGESDVSEALTLMCHQILPSLPFLSQSGVQADTVTLEELREHWCAFLEKHLSESKVEKLQDLLTKMFDNFNDVKLDPPQSVKLSDMTDLHTHYTALMYRAQEAGHLHTALA